LAEYNKKWKEFFVEVLSFYTEVRYVNYKINIEDSVDEEHAQLIFEKSKEALV